MREPANTNTLEEINEYYKILLKYRDSVNELALRVHSENLLTLSKNLTMILDKVCMKRLRHPDFVM